MPDIDELPPGVVRVRARNPSPLTLDGTNTYVTRAWVVDPGPDDAAHLDAVLAASPRPLEGIVLTHSHPDHAAGAPELARRAGVGVHQPRGGDRVGPFETIATPGHSPDSVTLVADGVAFAGDTVLGHGSVFVSPGEGSLSAYLASLERLRALDLVAICPGHGPVVWNVGAKLDGYIAHRLERERMLLDALERGARTEDELLAQAWADVDLEATPYLRFAAALTLRTHLEKLASEQRLPEGVAAELLAD